MTLSLSPGKCTFELLLSYFDPNAFELLLAYLNGFGEWGPVAGEADHKAR